jgi:glycosyltransferase involved in cell wall biosynthesis
VKSQKYENLELIVVDGNSTDSTISIIHQYNGIITYFISENDEGQTDAINKGFALATGDIINWLNSDDLLLPNALNTIAELFLKNKNLDILCAKEFTFNSNDLTPLNFHHGSQVYGNVEETFYFGIIDQPCTFFRRLAVIKYFPLSTELKYTMDRELWLSYLCENGLSRIMKFDKVLTAFRLHDQSKSCSEGHLFEYEFAAVKLKIIEYLGAHQDLLIQMHLNSHGFIYKSDRFKNLNWDIINKPKLLSLYAFELALKSYVHDELDNSKNMMSYIKKLHQLKLDYLPLYIKTNILPKSWLKSVKKFKQLF